MNGLKIVKTIVFLLTFCLFFGTFAALKIVYEKQQKTSSVQTSVNLMQPDGSSIKNIVAGEKDLYIMVEGGGLSDRILVFSPEENRIIFTINTN